MDGMNTVFTWKKDKSRKEMKRAVSYAVYDFPPQTAVDIDNPAYLKLITRANSVAFNGDMTGHTLVVTALDHLQNESKPRILKVK